MALKGGKKLLSKLETRVSDLCFKDGVTVAVALGVRSKVLQKEKRT